MRHILPLLLLFPIPAAATVLLPADFTEMVTTSRAIVHGRVVDVRSEVVPDRTSIVTFVTLDVEEHLKGALGDTITFRVPGGQVGRYRRIVIGAPEFREGEDVIVFLSARGPSYPYIYGLSQGVYRVAADGDGRRRVMPPPSTALGDAAGRVVRGDPARRPLAVGDFNRAVRAIVERAR
jgi:hypothetical protein